MSPVPCAQVVRMCSVTLGEQRQQQQRVLVASLPIPTRRALQNVGLSMFRESPLTTDEGGEDEEWEEHGNAGHDGVLARAAAPEPARGVFRRRGPHKAQTDLLNVAKPRLKACGCTPERALGPTPGADTHAQSHGVLPGWACVFAPWRGVMMSAKSGEWLPRCCTRGARGSPPTHGPAQPLPRPCLPAVPHNLHPTRARPVDRGAQQPRMPARPSTTVTATTAQKAAAKSPVRELEDRMAPRALHAVVIDHAPPPPRPEWTRACPRRRRVAPCVTPMGRRGRASL